MGLIFQHYAVPFILVEKEEHASILPRGRGWDVRTLEIFRQVGVEEAGEFTTLTQNSCASNCLQLLQPPNPQPYNLYCSNRTTTPVWNQDFGDSIVRMGPSL